MNHSACESKEEIDHYYWRLGALACLIWAVGGLDANAPNVIAEGEYPVLIDTEILVTPGHETFDELSKEFRGVGIGPVAASRILGNKMSIGAASLSGIACVHGDNLEGKRCLWCHNVPYFGNQAFTIEGRESQLITGFAEALGALCAHNASSSSAWLPELLQDTRCRVVLRPTAAYCVVRRWLFARLARTDVLRDLEGLLYDLPLRFPVSSRLLPSVIRAEMDALLVGDVPRFELAASDRNLSQNGVTLVRFRYSGVERAEKRVASLGPHVYFKAIAAWRRFVMDSLRS